MASTAHPIVLLKAAAQNDKLAEEKSEGRSARYCCRTSEPQAALHWVAVPHIPYLSDVLGAEAAHHVAGAEKHQRLV